MNNLSHALELADRGLSVIPILSGDKRPLIPWEKYQHTRATEEQISEWWGKTPNANIGIVTGEISGIDILDIDTQEGRDRMDEDLPEMLETPVCRTPSGGWHYYFKHTDGIRRTIKFVPGCDFLADGGYAL